MTEDEPTARVTMLWPQSLKEEVRKFVGARGLTEFAVDAVRARLSGHPEAEGLRREVGELRALAQQLADQLALGGDFDDRRAAFMELQLPSWMQTVGWPDVLAERVLLSQEDIEHREAIGRSYAEELADQDSEVTTCSACGGDGCAECNDVGQWVAGSSEDPDMHRPMALTKPHGQVTDYTTREPDDLLARIAVKAKEKGVDISGAGLRPASSMKSIEKQGASSSTTAIPTPGPSKLEVPPDVPTPVTEAPSTRPSSPNACPNCGAELISGECWSCM